MKICEEPASLTLKDSKDMPEMPPKVHELEQSYANLPAGQIWHNAYFF